MTSIGEQLHRWFVRYGVLSAVTHKGTYRLTDQGRSVINEATKRSRAAGLDPKSDATIPIFERVDEETRGVAA